jgi:hypothetical protein
MVFTDCSADGHLAACDDSGGTSISRKLLGRLAQAYIAEAVLVHELRGPGMAEAAEQLPDLAVPLAARTYKVRD